MKHTKRLQLLHDAAQASIMALLPRWAWRLKFVRSWASGVALDIAATTAKSTAKHVKEAYQAGWDGRKREENFNRRTRAFAKDIESAIYSKDQGWEA